MSFLVHIDNAKREIMAADSLVKIKDLWNKADAMRQLGQAAKDPELINSATEFKLRCERRLGEMLTNEIQQGGHNKKQSPTPLTLLSDVGIDRNLSARAQRIAAVPEAKFEAAIATIKDEERDLTRRAFETITSMAHVGYNAGDNEWYTPKEIVESSRLVMERIDLDPASSEDAQRIIKANRYFTIDNSSLNVPWEGNVWLNPPYAQPAISQFIDKLVDEKGVHEWMALTNNATETAWGQRLLSSADAACFPSGRIKFWHPSKESVPLQGQMICYRGTNRNGFKKEFKKHGEVLQK